MTRNSARLLLRIAAACFFSSGLLAPAAAPTVSFVAHRDFESGATPVFVAVGDFNGDRVQDLAIANNHDNTVSVLLGKGDGTFLAARAFAVGTNPVSVAVRDFNGDGRLDLAV